MKTELVNTFQMLNSAWHIVSTTQVLAEIIITDIHDMLVVTFIKS